MKMLVGATLALLAGCNGAASPPSGIAGANPPAAAGRAALAQDAYVGLCCGVLNHGDVAVFTSGLTKGAGHIFRGDLSPFGLAVDRDATLYVLDIYCCVTEYDRGAVRRSRRIAALYGAYAEALDKSGDLYVINCFSCIPNARRASSQGDVVNVYAPRSKKLLRTITQGIAGPHALAFDPSGNLYVANGSGKYQAITVYAPGSSKLSRRIARGLTYSGALATDSKGNVYVTNEDEVLEYAAGGDTIVREITDAISTPQALAFDTSDALYVANDSAYPKKGWVSVYAQGATDPELTITDGVTVPLALAFDNAGNLYVAGSGLGNPDSRGRVSVYRPGSKTPMRSVHGGKYGEPVSLAVGPAR